MQEHASKQDILDHQQSIASLQDISTCSVPLYDNGWTLFLAIKKNRSVPWYGTCAPLKGPSGNNIIITRSRGVHQPNELNNPIQTASTQPKKNNLKLLGWVVGFVYVNPKLLGWVVRVVRYEFCLCQSKTFGLGSGLWISQPNPTREINN